MVNRGLRRLADANISNKQLRKIAQQMSEQRQTDDSGLVLIKDRSHIRHANLLIQAEKEGRIGGKFKCLTCGMRYHIQADARNCCDLNL